MSVAGSVARKLNDSPEVKHPLWAALMVEFLRLHRRIGLRTLAKEVGVSAETVRKLILGDNTMTVAWYEALDSAITRITDSRGGVQTGPGNQEIRRYLESDQIGGTGEGSG